MLSQDTISKVANLIKGISLAETQAEVVRQVLCEQPNFEPSSAFQRISSLSAVITNQRIADFLAENDINISKQEAYHLVRVFDINGDGKVTYDEFLQGILPRTDQALRKEILSRKKQTIEEDEGLSYKVEHALARIFEEELESIKENEKIKQRLSCCEDFTVLDAFKEIDREDFGYIDANMVDQFMKNAGAPLPTHQIEAFMARTDKNADGILRYSDFVEIFFSHDTSDVRKTPSPIKYTKSPPKTNKTFESSTYASPKKDNSAAKAWSPVDNFNSPSTMANSSIYKTPTKGSATKIMKEHDHSGNYVFHPPTQGSYYTVNMGPKFESPMKTKEEAEFVKALKEMFDHIRKFEVVKNTLALKNDFNTYNAFIVFDSEGKGVVNTREFEKGLENLNVRINKSELDLLVKRLDQDCDGLITYEDFTEVILPKSGEFAKLVGPRQPYYFSEIEDALDAFTAETKEALRDFLYSFIEEEVLWESIKQRLAKRKTFNLHDAYNGLDRYNNGYITTEQFRDLLQGKGVFVSQKDVNTFVERFAKSVRGKISYYDFIREMTPKSVEKYSH